MTPSPDAHPPQRILQARLLSLLQAGDVDAALQAGLMDYAASAGDATDAPILAQQQQLRAAWAARARYRAREVRLARHATERAARRAPTEAPPGAAAAVAPKAAAPALPAAAAAALARARARATGRGDG